jgi:alkylation response protein AidB-like acyl-CoA dehydrogenase
MQPVRPEMEWRDVKVGRSVETDTRYHPTAEQLALGSTIGESLDELLPLSRLHSLQREEDSTWKNLEDIGIFGIGVSEALGGSGLGAVEEALIVMRLGRRLASLGVLATMGAAQVQLSEEAAALRGSRAVAAYRDGERLIVVDEPGASLLLLRSRAGATLHRAPVRAGRIVDDRLWLAALRELSDVGDPLARFEPAQLARLRLIDAAALAGIAEAALEMGVAYAEIRHQFGRPIGSFQAVKHHCADMAIAARCARDQTNFAAVAWDEGRLDAPLQVESAFFVSGSAALENAAKNIQIHGGMGFSDEADPHLFLKRAQLVVAIAGGLEAASGRISTLKADW